MATSTLAQSKSGSTERDAAEAARRLNAARASSDADNERRKSEAADDDKLTKRVAAAAAAELMRDGDEKSKAIGERGQQSLDAALKNVTAQGKELLEKGAKVGASKAPPKPDVIPDALSEAKPQPLTPAPIEMPVEEGGKTVITSTGAAFFDADKAIALFTDNVEVHHPQFYIQADEFEVHMVKEEEAAKADAQAAKKKTVDPLKAKPAAQQGTALSFAAPGAVFSQPQPGSAPPAADNTVAAKETGDSNIKKAVARGRKVTIEKLTENGDIQVGTCKQATYLGATGETILREMPQVQRGRNLQIATDPSTYMIIYQNGAMKTFGPSRTEILQSSEPKGGTHFKPGGQSATQGATPAPKPQIVQ